MSNVVTGWFAEEPLCHCHASNAAELISMDVGLLGNHGGDGRVDGCDGWYVEIDKPAQTSETVML